MGRQLVVLKAGDGPEAARDRFAEYSRSSSYRLDLGIREIRMLGNRSYRRPFALDDAADLATLQKLCDKGLVDGLYSGRAWLTRAGQLARGLIVESRHVVEAPPPSAACKCRCHRTEE